MQSNRHSLLCYCQDLGKIFTEKKWHYILIIPRRWAWVQALTTSALGNSRWYPLDGYHSWPGRFGELTTLCPCLGSPACSLFTVTTELSLRCLSNTAHNNFDTKGYHNLQIREVHNFLEWAPKKKVTTQLCVDCWKHQRGDMRGSTYVNKGSNRFRGPEPSFARYWRAAGQEILCQLYKKSLHHHDAIWGFGVVINTGVILQGTRHCTQVGDYECSEKNSIEEMENKFHPNIRKRLWTWGLPKPTALQPSDPSWKEHRLSRRK